MSRGLSTAQVRTLEAIAGASGRGAPFIPPNGPSGRPAKFLQAAELIEERHGNRGAFWITESGRAALKLAKEGTPP